MAASHAGDHGHITGGLYADDDEYGQREHDFQFVGGDMTNTTPIVGKQAYIEIIKRFSQVFKSMRVKEMIIEGSKACVIGNYDYQFPNGQQMNGNVAELWTAKGGKLQSLTIYFDTLTFANNSK